MARKKMTEEELASLLDGQIADAVSYEEAELSALRDKALAYRDGEMEDVPAESGKSSVVSYDVQDTIAWIKPGLMRIFANSDRVVEFEPKGPGDEEAAQQATDYINYVFQRECNGYKVLLDAFDDSLGLGNGVILHWWDPTPCYETESFSGLSDDAFTDLVSDDNVEVLEHTERPAPQDGAAGYGESQPQAGRGGDPSGAGLPDLGGGALGAPELEAGGGGLPQGAGTVGVPGMVGPNLVHDLKIKRTIPTGRLRIEALPPEELLIPRDAKVIDEDVSAIGRQRIVTRSTLIKEGYKRSEIEELPAYQDEASESAAHARDSSWTWRGTTNPDKSMERVRVFEWYPLVDYDGDGVAERRRVVISDRGQRTDDGKRLRAILANDEWSDDLPFTELVPNPVPHRRRGRSIFDDTQDIQRIKSVLFRQTLDNLYRVNNPMMAAHMAMVENPDQLINQELGGIVWTKGDPSGAIIPLAVPYVAENSFTAMEYFDAVKQGRTGVGRQTMGLDPDALQNQTAEAVRDGRAASETQVEYFARNLAETGLKRLFTCIFKLVVKHQDRPKAIRLRDQWVEMDPRPWNASMDCAINVGLGAGSKDRDMVMLQAIAGKQELILQNMGPDNPVCSLTEYRATLAEMVEVGGLRTADKYFKEVTPEAVQAMMEQMGQKQDPAIQIAQMKAETDMQALQMKGQLDSQKQSVDAEIKQREMQMKAEIERLQAEADVAVEQRKIEAQIQLEREKFELERELKLMEHSIKREQMQSDMQMKQADHQLKERDMHVQHEFKSKEMEAKAASDGLKKHKGDNGDEYLNNEEVRGRRMEQMMQMMTQALKRPKGTRIVRDAKGKAERAEYEYD
jgi:hypothetical protein